MADSARYVLLPCIIVGSALLAPSARAEDVKPVKNVIVLIADGCSSEQYTLARWFKGEPLALDGILVGGVKTYDHRLRGCRFRSRGDRVRHRLSHQRQVHRRRSQAGHVAARPGTAGGSAVSPAGHGAGRARLLGKATGIVATSRVTSRHAGRVHGARCFAQAGRRHHGANRLPECGRGAGRRQGLPASQTENDKLPKSNRAGGATERTCRRAAGTRVLGRGGSRRAGGRQGGQGVWRVRHGAAGCGDRPAADPSAGTDAGGDDRARRSSCCRPTPTASS